MPVNLPTNLLRSFVAIVDTGSMLNASNQVYVTQSALSLQIKRLEELVQQPLFTRDGRRLALTAPGEVLLDYARRVLALHDEAIVAVNAGRFAGSVRVGTVQDFADTLLSGLLARFANLHPDAQIYARVAGTAELQGLLERGQLDMLIGYSASDDPAAVRVSPMAWFGSSGTPGPGQSPCPRPRRAAGNRRGIARPRIRRRWPVLVDPAFVLPRPSAERRNRRR